MRLLLVEITCPDIRAFGVRSLSSYVKKAGQDVNILFIPPYFEHLRSKSGTVHLYSDEIISEYVELCRNYDLIGISFMTYYFDRAIQLTEAVKNELNLPVVWGGIHASTKPEESLEYADIVCIGEGEEALVELMDNMERDKDISSIRNIWSNNKKSIHRNLSRPLIQNIDSLPFPDYDISTHYTYSLFDEHIVPLNEKLMKFYSLAGPFNQLGTFYQYKTMASRGCPHSCSFCCNSIYRDMYKKQRYLRWRSNEMIFQEIEHVLKLIPYFNSVMFFDDSFFATSSKRMKEFTTEYKQRIGLPIATQSSPQTTNYEKVKLLVEAGMVYLEMGIQSGSDRINKMYRREQTKEEVIQATKAINAFKDKMLPPDYHLILDNNWETDEDVLETLDLVLSIPKPFGLKPSSLVLYPGTELYYKALSEKLIKDEKREVYRKAFGAPKSTYLNFLILLVNFSFIPGSLIRFAKRPIFIKIFSYPFFKPFISITRYSLFQTERVLNKIRRTFYKKKILE